MPSADFRCPKCGSSDTRVARGSIYNLRLSIAAVVLFNFGQLYGTPKFERKCQACRKRFIP